MARKPAQTDTQRRKALQALYRGFRHRSNVTGFDIGYRWTGGKPTKSTCVRVHVHSKIPVAELSDLELFPEEIEGVPLDVMTGPYRITNELGTTGMDQTSAILSGTSCRRSTGGSGTIGAIAIDKASGRAGILSNWHVLSTYRGIPGDLIYDTGPDARPIARLSQSILSRDGDAAFAPFEGAQPWLPTLRALNLNLSGVRNSRLGEVLCKYGRATQLTRARVDGEGIYRITQYTGPSMWSVVEIVGFRLAPEKPGGSDIEISAPGDSGACWVSPGSGQVAGLHMAGEGAFEPNEEYALACNMPKVLERLGLRLATMDDLVETGMLAAAETSDFMARWVANTPQALAPAMDRGGDLGSVDGTGSIAPTPSTCPCCGHSGGALPGLGAMPQTKPLMNVSGNIWSEFLSSLRRRHPALATAMIGINDDIATFFPTGDRPSIMRDIILNSPRFFTDDSIPTLKRLRPELVFRGVCIAVGEEYQRLGFPTAP